MKTLSRILFAIAAVAIWLAYTPSIPEAKLMAKYTNEASQFVADSRGLKVHFRDQGPQSGKVIVLLHGNSNSLHYFEPLVELLLDKHRIITLDFPGHGLTGAHPNDDYSVSGLSDALDLVVAELALDRFVLLGHSMGGWVAWRYTVENPELVDSLILVAASGMPQTPEEQARDAGLGFKLLQSPIGPVLSGFTIPRRTIEKSMEKSVVTRLENQEYLVTLSWELLLHPENRKALASRTHLDRDLEKAYLATRIEQPTLLIWGEEDSFVPPSAALSFAERIHNSQILMLPGVGHMPILEARRDVAHAISRVVSEQ